MLRCSLQIIFDLSKLQYHVEKTNANTIFLASDMKKNVHKNIMKFSHFSGSMYQFTALVSCSHRAIEHADENSHSSLKRRGLQLDWSLKNENFNKSDL